jgi:hypothetical protein
MDRAVSVPRFPLAAAALAAGLLAAPAAQADLRLDFDSGLQGATVEDGGTVVHQASGGAGGGFLQATDVTGGDMLLVLPAGSLGNWSAYLGGTLSFDARNLNGDAPDWGGFGELTLAGSSGSVMVDIVPLAAPPADGAWHRYSVVLNQATFGAQLPALLANLGSVKLKIEFHNGISEVVGIDNLAVTAVPEPASAALLLGGLAALGWRRRR